MAKGHLKTSLLLCIFQALLVTVGGYLLASQQVINAKKTHSQVQAEAAKLQKEYDDYYFKNKSKLSNVALRKPARQSSTWGGYGADRALDGNKNPRVGSGSCQHTSINRIHEWWKVDLGRMYRIFFIDITPRWDDCPSCRKRLHYFSVDVFDGPVEHSTTTKQRCFFYRDAMISPKTVSTRCSDGPKNGRMVRITNAYNTYLTMCEVEIYALPLMHFQISNVAYNKPTAQSSTYNSRYESKRAVDGVTNSTPLGLCAMTSLSYGDRHEWWQTDLQGIFHVYSISITPRFYCQACNFVFKKHHIWKFDVNVYSQLPDKAGSKMTPCLKDQRLVDFTVYSQACNPLAPKGRVVRIVGENSLILCEVEVNAFPYLYDFPPD